MRLGAEDIELRLHPLAVEGLRLAEVFLQRGKVRFSDVQGCLRAQNLVEGVANIQNRLLSRALELDLSREGAQLGDVARRAQRTRDIDLLADHQLCVPAVERGDIDRLRSAITPGEGDRACLIVAGDGCLSSGLDAAGSHRLGHARLSDIELVLGNLDRAVAFQGNRHAILKREDARLWRRCGRRWRRRRGRRGGRGLRRRFRWLGCQGFCRRDASGQQRKRDSAG